jgi:hypothetical protein
MKTLVIYTNKSQYAILFKNMIDINDNIDIFLDNSCSCENELYRKCPKVYCYYLFLNNIINLSDFDLNNLIYILKTEKPAIIYLSKINKIYHRSIIHYVYPLASYLKYGEHIYYIQDIIERPLYKYTHYFNQKLPINNGSISKDLKYQQMMRSAVHWFNPAIKKYDQNIDYNYEKIEGEIDNINFLNTFDIFQYFNINHQYFKEKRIKFHKNNREIYGDCSMYHFRHDFHNINRNSIVNHLIKKYNCKKYLEIGVYNCYHFNDVYVDEKYGVDPFPKLDDPIYQHWANQIYRMKSSDFFEKIDPMEKYDLIFIDGCLYEENVMNDILKSLEHLTENGTIVLHDCNPPIEFLQRDDYNTKYCGIKGDKIIWNNRTYSDRHYQGFAWKVITKLRCEREDLEISVVDCDWGVGIIRRGKQELFKMVEDKKEIYKYETFIKYRKYMLNLISAEKFLELYK